MKRKKSPSTTFVNTAWAPNAKSIGLHSFTFDLSKKSGADQCIGDAVTFCLSLLKKVDYYTGLCVSAECPLFLKNWGKLSIDRRCPIRQYFGFNDEATSPRGRKDVVSRACYGYSASAVGCDMKSTVTREMPLSLVNLANHLSDAYNERFKRGHDRYAKKKVCFNHVTILYYLTDPNGDCESDRSSTLNFHADVSRTADNQSRSLHQQVSKSPTISLSLGDTKDLVFAKRYVEDGKFSDNLQNVTTKSLKHGSFHFLHPGDEAVFHRRVQWNGDRKSVRKEDKRSQFLHMVKCSSKKSDSHVKISVTLCFREVNYRMVNTRTNTLFDLDTNKFVANDVSTPAMRARNLALKEARDVVMKPEKREAILQQLKPFHERLRNIHKIWKEGDSGNK